MDVESSLTILGGFGLLQTVNFLIIGTCGSIMAWQMTGISFTLAVPEAYWCSLPPNGTGGTEGSYAPRECTLVHYNGSGGDNHTTSCIYGRDYNFTHGETTCVTDLDLVCDRAVLAETLGSIFFGGIFAGSFLSGQLSDIFGRRPVIMVGTLGSIVTGVGMSFTWNYGLMCVLRFLNGFFVPSVLSVSYVRIIEMCTPHNRLKGQLAAEMIWVVALILVAPMAYLFPNWRHLQLAFSLSLIPFMPLLWFCFESIRWLAQKGRIKEAEKLLQKIAKSKNIPHSGYFLLPQRDTDGQNGAIPVKTDVIELESKSAPENASSSGGLDTTKTDSVNGAETKTDDQTEGSEKGQKGTICDLFRSRSLTLRTLIVSYCWLVGTVVYYGFFINSPNLVGNKYLNFFLICLTEAPCYVLNYFVMTRHGRKRPLMFYYFLSGAFCVVTGVIPHKTGGGVSLTMVILVMALIGKFFASAAFDIAYLVTAEVFPTIVRNAAVGFTSSIARAGGMLAPFIVHLSVFHKSLPMIVFGVISLVGGFLVIFLPETSHKALPETMDDGLNLDRNARGGVEEVVSPARV